jgi:hypothetical protein
VCLPKHLLFTFRILGDYGVQSVLIEKILLSLGHCCLRNPRDQIWKPSSEEEDQDELPLSCVIHEHYGFLHS